MTENSAACQIKQPPAVAGLSVYSVKMTRIQHKKRLLQIAALTH